MTDLNDPTDAPNEAALVANSGEFAARWNAWTEDERERVLRAIQGNARDAINCFAGNHVGHIAELEDQVRRLQADLLVAKEPRP